jgi:hypothetical protein
VTKLRPIVTNFNGIAGRTITSPLDRRGGLQPRGINPVDPLEEQEIDFSVE